MPWINNEFIYTKKLLKAIAKSYESIYEGLPVSWKAEVYNPWAIAEYKADFDVALDSIGKGHWKGEIDGSNLANYRQFGHLQQVVIADILGKDLGFYQVAQLRGRAYRWMANCLNGLPFGSQYTRSTKCIS